jgi:hypothetical protein
MGNLIVLARFSAFLLSVVGISDMAMAEQRCEAYFFEKSPSNQFRPATVVGKQSSRVYFHNRGGICPAESCRRNTYVAPGDRLLANQMTGNWACVYFKGVGKAPIIGWLPKNQLKVFAPDHHPSQEAWQGNWATERSRLHIESGSKSGAVTVHGAALWGDGPAPHTGSVEGTAAPVGNQVRIKDGACEINLSLVDEWLIASDNNECGGLNVTFTSVYRKDAPK